MRIRALLINLVVILTASSALAQSSPPTPMWAPGQMVVDDTEVGRIVGKISRASTGEPVGGTQIELLRPSLSEGRVFPEPWVPTGEHAKAAVVARLLSATDGSFRLDGVAPGSYVIRSAAAPKGPGQSQVVLSVEQPVRTVTLILDHGRQAEGSVVDSEGEPLSQVFVYVSGIDRGDGLNSVGPGGSAPWTRTDRRGYFHLTQLPQGTLYLQAAHIEIGFSDIIPVPESALGSELHFEITVDRARFDPNQNPGGIGVSLRWTPAGPTISRVLPEKPAARADLLVGDLITAIDGRSTLFMSSVEFIARCRGPVGEAVHLRVRRAQHIVDVQIEREQLSP